MWMVELSALIWFSFAKVSQGEEASWTSWRSALTSSSSLSNPCHLFQKPDPSGKDDRDLGRRRNFSASECKQLACLSLSEAWRQQDRASGHQCQRGLGLWSLDVTLNLPGRKIRGPATPVVQSWYKQLHAKYAGILRKLLYGCPMQNTCRFICLVRTIMCL